MFLPLHDRDITSVPIIFIKNTMIRGFDKTLLASTLSTLENET